MPTTTGSFLTLHFSVATLASILTEELVRYACLTVSRFTSVAWRGAAVSATRAAFPGIFGGWPVGGGNDITG